MDDSLKITALPPDKLVLLLQRAGTNNFTLEMLQADLRSGAPVSADRTINFIEYTAWVLRKVNNHGNESQ